MPSFYLQVINLKKDATKALNSMDDLNLKKLLKGQTVWVVLMLIVVGLFAYGEFNRTRLFNETPSENWQPSGSGSHAKHSNIHHK